MDGREVKGRERGRKVEIGREGGKEDEEVVKPWAGGSLPCTSGKDMWIVLGPARASWETSYLPVVGSLLERMRKLRIGQLFGS